MTDKYSIKMLQIGYCPRHTSEFSFDGDYNAGEHREALPFVMVLLQNEDHNILIDTGCDLTEPAKQQIHAVSHAACGRSPSEVLAAVGLSCDDIDAVIITQCHWDHIGGIADFPNADVYVQKEDLFRWIDLCSKPATYSIARCVVDSWDHGDNVKHEQKGTLHLLEGDVDDLFPGISVKVFRDGQYSMIQNVLVDTKKGTYMLGKGNLCG